MLHHTRKHPEASIRSSLKRFLSGVKGFFALLKARLHSRDIAGQANMSRAQRCKVGELSRTPGRLHQALGSNLSVREVAEPAVEYLLNSPPTEMPSFLYGVATPQRRLAS